MIWGERTPESEPPPMPRKDERPGTPTAAAEWDRKQVMESWRATDALMARVRAR